LPASIHVYFSMSDARRKLIYNADHNKKKDNNNTRSDTRHHSS